MDGGGSPQAVLRITSFSKTVRKFEQKCPEQWLVWLNWFSGNPQRLINHANGGV